MGFRKKKKVEEEVIEEVKEEEAVEEVEDEILPLDEDETPDDSKETGDIEDIEEAPKAETDIRIGNKVKIKRPRDYDGRPITVDEFSSFTVYAIEGNKVQLRGSFGRILFVRLSNIKKIK